MPGQQARGGGLGGMPYVLRTRRMKRLAAQGEPHDENLRWLLPILVAGLAAYYYDNATLRGGCGDPPRKSVFTL